MLEMMQIELIRKAPICRNFAEPSDGLEPSTPPYHGTFPAASGEPWQTIALVYAPLASVRTQLFAVRCPRVFPGSFPCMVDAGPGLRCTYDHPQDARARPGVACAPCPSS